MPKRHPSLVEAQPQGLVGGLKMSSCSSSRMSGRYPYRTGRGLVVYLLCIGVIRQNMGRYNDNNQRMTTNHRTIGASKTGFDFFPSL